jgi:very-short-patch-repair endonuclease
MPKIILFEKSFASHPKSIYWSSRNEDKPDMCALNSHTKYWFDCDKCCHDFEQDLNHINIWNRWCPYCSNQKLCDNNNCNTCFNKSFASHPKSKLLLIDKNKNNYSSRNIFLNSNKKFLFNCDKCEHIFEITLNKITSLTRWCPYCSNSKLCEDKECIICFNKSFASIEKSKYLSDKNIIPRMLFKSSNKKYNFNCNECNNIFICYLSCVTKGIWCPYCINKTEKILFDKLVKKYKTLKRQYKVKWCRNIKYLPFDFVIEELKIIIELDGKQHFEQVGSWLSPELTFKNDIYKMNCANQNNYSVIRILQKDIWHNKYDWLNELCDNINKINYDNRVQNIYMCKNNEYKNFDENLEIPNLYC